MFAVSKLFATLVVAGGLALASTAQAADVTVQMLNKGPTGMMTFSPTLVKIAPGDTVHFVATDKGHNVESIDGMAPEGAQPFAGKMNEGLDVKFDKEGLHGFRCKPHYGMGMVGLIVVGKASNEDAAKAVQHPGMAKKAFSKLFEQLDAR
jgi:pseudoazurin